MGGAAARKRRFSMSLFLDESTWTRQSGSRARRFVDNRWRRDAIWLTGGVQMATNMPMVVMATGDGEYGALHERDGVG